MSKYVVLYRMPLTLDHVIVQRFEKLGDAQTQATLPDRDPAVGAFVVDPETGFVSDMGTPFLVNLFNLWRAPDDKEIKKFENRNIARNRFIARLEANFQTQPVFEVPAKATVSQSETVPSETVQQPEGESDLSANGKPKKAKAGGKPREKSTREVGKPAGLVSDFGQVREGTDRAKILKAMDGSRTTAALAKLIDKDEKTVMTIAYCIHRDCGIGYKLEDGKLLAIYPGSKTFEDALKKAEKKKAD